MALTFPTWGLHPHTLPMGQGLHLSTGLDLLSLPELCCRCTCVQFRHSHAWPWALSVCSLSHRLTSQLDLGPDSSPWTCLIIWGKLATRVEPNYHPYVCPACLSWVRQGWPWLVRPLPCQPCYHSWSSWPLLYPHTNSTAHDSWVTSPKVTQLAKTDNNS